ncbi:DHA2 family efflux MFS transporter permease subunit [Clostridium thailandense]|uniref:DHA2 family efflux MFS transporter permease subunit n=1 Tax=Clostridium thailandense TaxID=2794346 RepID=UPI00398A3410
MDKSNKSEEKWLIPVLIALIGALMSILDSSIVNVAIPTMMHVFNTDTSTIEWVVTVYMLALGVVVPFSGWTGEKYGYKQVYMAAMVIFTVGSLLCAVSWSVNSLIVSRVLQALGGGMIMPTTMTMIKKIVPKNKFGTAMGVIGIALLMGPAIGPTVGGYLVEYIDWRWIFTINLPIGVIGILLSYFFLPEISTSKVGNLDIAGGLISATMLFTLLLALSKGADWGWTSEPTVLLLYISSVTFILFIYIELTSKNPLLNIRVFKYTTFAMANFMSIITNIALFSGIFFIPLFLQNIRGLGALETGLIMLPGALVSGLMMPISGKLYDHVGPRFMSMAGITCLCYTIYLFHNIDINTPTTTIMLWMVLRGAGTSFASMPAQTASIDSVPQEDVGAASAISNIVSRISGSFGIAILTEILNSRVSFYTASMNSQLTSRNLGLSGLTQKFSSYFGSGHIAQPLEIASIKGLVAQASFVRSLDDIFIITSCFTILGLIPAFFLKKSDASNDESIIPE